MRKAVSPISKNIQVPYKNNIAETSGNPHKFLIRFPAMMPMKIKYIGLIAKNSNKQAAIPASPFTKVMISQGKVSITTVEIATQKMNLFFIKVINTSDKTNFSFSSIFPHKLGFVEFLAYVSLVLPISSKFPSGSAT